MFEYGWMTVTSLASARTPEQKLAEIDELRQRVHRMQGTAVPQTLPTLPALTDLIRLQSGASYSVDRPALAMALMAGPSRAGSWSAVIGVRDFGLEAAAEIGVDLDRTVLVPEPGDAWLEVAAALIDVLQVVVVRPPGAVNQHQAARLASRLRQRDAVLVSVGRWPRAEAALSIRSSQWVGIGRGHGRLTAHRAWVSAELRTGQVRDAELWLPGVDLEVRQVEQPAQQETGLYAVQAG